MKTTRRGFFGAVAALAARPTAAPTQMPVAPAHPRVVEVVLDGRKLAEALSREFALTYSLRSQRVR